MKALVGPPARDLRGPVGFLFVGLFATRAVPSPLIDKPAPAFSLADLHRPGRRVATSDFKRARSGSSTSGRRGASPAASSTRCSSSSRSRTWCRSSGSTTRTKDAEGRALARAARPHAVGRRADGRSRDRLGRLRRARDLRRRQGRRDPYKHIGPLSAEALQQTILPLVRRLQAVMSARTLARFAAALGALAGATARVSPRPTRRSSARLKRLETDLRCLVCQTTRRLERAARRGPAPRGARARGVGSKSDAGSAPSSSRATATSSSTSRRSRESTWLLWFRPFLLPAAVSPCGSPSLRRRRRAVPAGDDGRAVARRRGTGWTAVVGRADPPPADAAPIGLGRPPHFQILRTSPGSSPQLAHNGAAFAPRSAWIASTFPARA